MRRRQVIQAGLLSAAGFAIAGVRPAASANGPRILTARAGRAPIHAGAAEGTAIWGYDGLSPGPLLRARQGETLNVRLANRLPQPTSIHWHGVRLPNAMDGVSGLTQDAVQPGADFDYEFPLTDAGTYWYHTHNRSWEQLARGLYGVLVVDEVEPPPIDQDVVFVIDDWRLDQSGAIHEASLGDIRDWAHAGRLGNWMTVNGQSEPRIPARAGDRIRMRILNAANARIATLMFPKHDPVVVALDGQPVEPFEPAGSRLRIAPAQRVDLMIDMGLASGSETPILEVGGRETVTVARFAYSPEAAHDRPSLPPVTALPANPIRTDLDMAGAVTAELVMEGGAMGRMAGASLDGRFLTMRELVTAGRVWAFNGVAGMPEQPLLRAETGQTVAIDMVNDTRWPHAMHLHGTHFTVIRRDRTPVDSGPWRDTELLDPGQRATIAFVADSPGKWLLHCHMLEHQAGGMVTWIEIV